MPLCAFELYQLRIDILRLAFRIRLPAKTPVPPLVQLMLLVVPPVTVTLLFTVTPVPIENSALLPIEIVAPEASPPPSMASKPPSWSVIAPP